MWTYQLDIFLTTLKKKGDFSTPLITYCEIVLRVYKHVKYVPVSSVLSRSWAQHSDKLENWRV